MEDRLVGRFVLLVAVAVVGELAVGGWSLLRFRRRPAVPLSVGPQCSSILPNLLPRLGHATVDSSASSSAARIWEFRSPDKKTIYTIDFVVIDQQKSTMEGLIPTNRIGQFKDQLKEGCVYTIDKFDLYDPKKSYWSVDNPLRIAFTMRTILTEVIPSPENFPMFAYTTLPFSMLSDRVDEVIVLSDIVGLVNKVTPILPPSGRAKSHKRQVYITDGSEHAVVTLWGDHADLFDADELMRASNEEPIIVLFVGMTVGLLSFMSTSATRWYVNAPIPEIADVQERYRFIARAIDAASADSEAAKFADLYLFGPRGEIVVGKEALTLLSSPRGEANAVPQDLLAIIGKEFNIVATPRRESLDSLHAHLQVQISEPIHRTNVALQQGLNDPPAGQVYKDLHTPKATYQVETTAGTSTPMSSTNLAPQHLPSSSCTTDKVPPDSPARGKHRVTSADKNPKAKKELRFLKDD
ncbi:hypothetical protein ACQ4PT_039920 [Festuca glaucescens]